MLATAALLLSAPVLAACGSGDDGSAVDAGADPGETMPASVPAADGTVHTRDVVTVMDDGGPELCLGAVAESWPPQCGGPAVEGWDWADHKGMFESQRGVRWGQFSVSGTWDGETFAVRDAVPAALHDALMVDPPSYPPPSVDHSAAELERIATEVGELPGAGGAYADDQGHVFVDVTYDDGSLQDWADETYGEWVVVVGSMLVDEPA